jgi:hypothetical protein
MANSKSAFGEGNEAAPHEKAVRRIDQLKLGLRVRTALLALLILGAAPALLTWAYFEAREKIADVLANEEEVQERARADRDALLHNSLRFVGVPAASVPMAADAYAGFLLLSLLGMGWLGRQRVRVKRAIRDQEAEYALLALRAGARPAQMIGCFLRSFKLDDIFGARDATLTEQARRQKRGGGTSLEQRLSIAFAGLPKPPIVCSVGRRKEGAAFGRIETSDSDWRAVVSTLMKEADFFVLIFGSSAGTAWEFDELSSNDLIERTLFILPSKTMLRQQFGMDALEIERGYTQLFGALSKIGYKPPAYEEGSAFYFKDGQAHSAYSNNAISTRAVASFIAGLPSRRTELSPH